MELIAIRFTEQIIEELDSLVKAGIYPSRSEVIREATRTLLKSHGTLYRAPEVAGIADEKAVVRDHTKMLGFEL